MTDDQYEQIGVPGCVEAVLIGSGGFGRVFAATQPAFGRKVAVKVLTGSLRDGKIKDRFERECHALGQASVHPNIVDVFDAGATEDDSPYMVMPFVKKGSYADRIATTGPIGWEEATKVGVKMAAALHTAHELGVLHRDIKPENILRSEFGEPMLADFGIAHLEGGKETSTGSVTASIAYAAPEILAVGKASVLSDVYSLASTIHAMILGRPPFWQPDEDSLLPMLNRISTVRPPDLRSRGVPDQVVRVLERGLAKKPEDRPPSAEAFGRALAWAQGQCGMTPTELIIHSQGEDEESVSAPRVVSPAPLASLASTSLPKPNPAHRREGPPPASVSGGLGEVVAQSATTPDPYAMGGQPNAYPNLGRTDPWQGGAPPVSQPAGLGQQGYAPHPAGWQHPSPQWGQQQVPLPSGGQRVPTIPNEFPVPGGAIVRRANAPAGAPRWWVEWVMPAPVPAVASFYGAFFSSDPYGYSAERPLNGGPAQVQGVFVSIRSRTRYQMEIRVQDNATVLVVAGTRF